MMFFAKFKKIPRNEIICNQANENNSKCSKPTPWNFFNFAKNIIFACSTYLIEKKGGSPASFLRKMSLNVKNRSFTSRSPVAMVTIFDPKIISAILRRDCLTIGCKNCSSTVSVDDVNGFGTLPHPNSVDWYEPP